MSRRYPPPSEVVECVCPNTVAQFFCPWGHVTECHWPMHCEDADCAHMDRYRQEDEDDELPFDPGP